MHTTEILKQVKETHRPIYITQNGDAAGVLIDTKSYELMKKTLGSLKVLTLGEKENDLGNVIEQSKLFSSLKKKYFTNIPCLIA